MSTSYGSIKNEYKEKCSFGAGHQKLCDPNKNECKICFDKSFASDEKSKYWSKRNDKEPRQCFKQSNKKYFFDCDICNHELYIALNNVYNGYWCAYCAHQKLCDNDCQFCYNNSFASNEKSKYLSNKNDLTPRQIFKSSTKKFLFNCDICNHEFDATPGHVTEGTWCPYCCNPPKKLCKDHDNCKFCYNNSFASNDKSKYWSMKNESKPRDNFKQSNKKFWFNCDICNHEFDATLAHVTEGTWCPYCAHQKICNNNDCKFCYENSFASDDKSKYWSIKNNKKPRQCFKSCNKSFWFNCDKYNHDFEMPLSDVTSGKWCSVCKNKTELKLYEFLLTKFKKEDIIKSFKQDWCMNKLFLPFDFLLILYKIIIELDGE